MNTAAQPELGTIVELDLGGAAARRADCPIVRIHLLGSMRATTYLGDSILPRGKKARAILGYLCLAAGAAVPRAHLAAMLWDQADDVQARSSFRQALSELLLAMGPLAEELISTDRETVRLNTAACWIDALALREPSSPDSVRSDLAVLCAGELLEKLDGASAAFDQWLLSERARFAQQVRGSLGPEFRQVDRPGSDARRNDSDAHQLLPGRNRLRVGVLPFDGNSSVNEKDLAFSLSHEIATALARFRWFDVVAPISMTRRPLGNFVSEDNLQRQQLNYAVDGVITQSGKYFQISVRLLDLTQSTQPVWSGRFKLAIDELHRLNEMVTAPIVASIDPVILFIEGQPSRKERYGASGLLFLAIPLIYSMERKKFRQAGELISQALQIDPQNAMAVTWAAYWHLWHVGQCWTPDTARTLSTVESLCLQALKLDPDNSEAMGIYAHTLAWKKEFDSAVHFFDRSLRRNPNLAYIWALSAATYCYIGEPDQALKRLSRYLDLAPFDPYYGFFEVVYTLAYTVKHDYEKAVVVGRRVIKANPEFINAYKPLIASLGHLGRRDEARPYIQKLLSLEPDFTIEKFTKVYPFKFSQDRDRYAQGLRLAGVPER